MGVLGPLWGFLVDLGGCIWVWLGVLENPILDFSDYKESESRCCRFLMGFQAPKWLGIWGILARFGGDPGSDSHVPQ